MEQICIVDALSAFFPRDIRGVVNWSRVPFESLESNGVADNELFFRIKRDLACLIKKVKNIGYNAMSFDDLAHLTSLEFYPESLKRRIVSYQVHYHELFRLVKSAGMNIFVTTDILFYNNSITEYLSTGMATVSELFRTVCDSFFSEFPEADGIITRIGECDGVDVQGPFKSSLTIKTPQEANSMIKYIVPVFERSGKTLIFRTWTVGAYPIGDLIWNHATYRQTFRDIESDNFIISMKYGDTDFFRYIELNPLFFERGHKIIELQARREYEGFGEYPSFIGWDYQKYLDKARGTDLVGIYVWCQGGGWSQFRRHTFVRDSSVWNELNTYTVLKMFREGISADDAVRGFCRETILSPDKFLEFLQLSDQVIKELLYVPEFSGKTLYFRRTRIPTSLLVYWENVTVNSMMRLVYSRFVKDKNEAVRQGNVAVKKILRMQRLAKEHNLPDLGLEFQLDTFRILALAREYLLLGRKRRRLQRMVTAYHNKYTTGYRFNITAASNLALFSPLLSLFIRQKRPYRHFDLIAGPVISSLLRIVIRTNLLPGFVNKRAMNLEAILE